MLYDQTALQSLGDMQEAFWCNVNLLFLRLLVNTVYLKKTKV